ncbi:MAG: hypothetical protein H0U72_03235 [Nitrosospira sp.]|nr:hypothetical protein [Nitrosospira sp.]
MKMKCRRLGGVLYSRLPRINPCAVDAAEFSREGVCRFLDEVGHDIEFLSALTSDSRFSYQQLSAVGHIFVILNYSTEAHTNF